MNTRRFFFLTGMALAALVLFGPVTGSAQVTTAVADVTAAALDHDSVRIRWTFTAAASGDEGFDGFEIRYQKGSTIVDGERFMYEDAGMSARTLIIDGLDHGATYAFQVRAAGETADGSATGSTWTPASSPPTAMTDAADPPDMVEDLELEAGDMMIMATWDPADTHDDFPLTGYQLMITPEDGNADVMNIGVMTEYTFDGLMNGTEYTVQVAARNEIDLGPYSDEEMATPMAGADGATPTPALPLFGAFALGAGLLAAGRARLRRREQRRLTR